MPTATPMVGNLWVVPDWGARVRGRTRKRDGVAGGWSRCGRQEGCLFRRPHLDQPFPSRVFAHPRAESTLSHGATPVAPILVRSATERVVKRGVKRGAGTEGSRGNGCGHAPCLHVRTPEPPTHKHVALRTRACATLASWRPPLDQPRLSLLCSRPPPVKHNLQDAPGDPPPCTQVLGHRREAIRARQAPALLLLHRA